MKRYFRIMAAFCGVLSVSAAYSAVPNNDHPATFLGPTLRGGFNSMLTDTSAYAISGEAGIRNLRAGGSVGWNIMQAHALKFSAEFLWQQINYAYFAGNNHDWANQGAVGAAYQYDLGRYVRFHPQLGLNGYYASASSAALGTETGTFINSSGVVQPFTNIQRLAGSHASGISPGFSIQAWQGMRAGIDLNYDNVRYDMRYEPSTTAKGWGGTAHLRQQLGDYIAVGASAAVREPFNHYQAELAWNTLPCYGAWSLKLIGAYTIGKHSLPNTYNVGFTVDYFLDMMRGIPEEDVKADFLAWMAKPAVYMPQVLAIADESVS
ncbi:hypothetical protein [Aquicella lusitana]|uniref:Uncharacterized protein n=1 Tax=Aquicella lusitana TaxID=254246 RepID=A0A370GAW6_9COXI|nr:hypothetical protein [Aquicella lusitana]RDI40972.1 hypothetical protein C8D86_12216 [Aquicella lusitana]VVC73623.1 hypothetical protein AQULUS_13700 [Aquicella lusitana]